MNGRAVFWLFFYVCPDAVGWILAAVAAASTRKDAELDGRIFARACVVAGKGKPCAQKTVFCR